MADPTYERDPAGGTNVRSFPTDRAGTYEPSAFQGTDPDAAAADDRSRAARDHSLGTLLKELRDEGLTLARQEIALAKTEMSEKASKAAKNAAAIAVGGAVAYLGAIVLLLGVTVIVYFALDRMGVPNWLAGLLSFLIVGGGTALVGYLMLQKGLSALKNESMVPEKTVESLKEDKQWLTNQTK